MDDKAAFGFYPQLKAKRTTQDPEAAKNVPIDLLRGRIAGTVGLPGDIEQLARDLAMLAGAPESQSFLPTTERVLPRIPLGSDTPVSRAASGLGSLTANPMDVVRAGKAATKAAKAAKPAVNQAIEDYMFNQGLALPVIKPKGGNWLNNSVEKSLENLKRPDRATGSRSDPKESMAEMRATYTPEVLAIMSPETQAHVARAMEDLERKIALNNWVDRNLTNYVKKEMATPDDPVRKLAEEGVIHMPSEQVGINRYKAKSHREKHGTQQLGQSDAAKAWEDASDVAMKPKTLDELSLAYLEPWMTKVPPETKIMHLSGDFDTGGLGFDHIMDVLRADVNAGRIRPEQLNKVSMEQAVRRTYEYDQEMARKMAEAQIKATEGMPIYKDYADKGYKWIELAPKEVKSKEDLGDLGLQAYFDYMKSGGDEAYALKAGQKADAQKYLEDALKYEGDTMGHCVGGYCPDVLEGRSRIFSLRDAKGEPHVTIEAAPPREPGWAEAREAGGDPRAIQDEAMRRMGLDPDSADETRDIVKNWDGDTRHAKQKEMNRHFADIYREQFGEPPQRIVQIKGKQNRAPKEDYLPYVQDFVRSGKWSDVGDLENTGLIKQDGKYMTQAEYDDYLLNQLQPPPVEGMKRGGKVSISDNCDCQMMELEDQKFATGGMIGKAVKSAIATRELEKQAILRAEAATKSAAKQALMPQYNEAVKGQTQKQNPPSFEQWKAINHPEPEMAEGGAAYNTDPDMSDGGQIIQGAPFKRGGDVNLDAMYMAVNDAKFRRK